MKKLFFLLLFLPLATPALPADLNGTTLILSGAVQNIGTILATAAAIPAGATCVKSVQLQAAAANANTTFVGGSAVANAANAWAIIPVGSAIGFSYGPDTGCINTSSIYVIGTNGEKLHISVIR